MRVVNLTTSQLESYRLIWGSFTNFGWTFLGRRRTFGFYGDLGVDETGRVDLLGLCVACSREHARDELQAEIQQLKQTLGPSNERRTDDFRVELLSDQTDQGTLASHLVMTYGDSEERRGGPLQSFRTEGGGVRRPSYCKKRVLSG